MAKAKSAGGKRYRKPRKTYSVLVRCPYYRGEYTINRYVFRECEGIFTGAGTVATQFRNRDYAERVSILFCERDWEKCPIARAIEEQKYSGRR